MSEWTSSQLILQDPPSIPARTGGGCLSCSPSLQILTVPQLPPPFKHHPFPWKNPNKSSMMSFHGFRSSIRGVLQCYGSNVEETSAAAKHIIPGSATPLSSGLGNFKNISTLHLGFPNMAVVKIPIWPIGNTSSIRVHVPASHVSLLQMSYTVDRAIYHNIPHELFMYSTTVWVSSPMIYNNPCSLMHSSHIAIGSMYGIFTDIYQLYIPYK